MRIPGLRVNARRRGLAVIATTLMCIGCTSPAALESQAASASAREAPNLTPSASITSTPAATPSTTAEPTPQPLPSPPLFGWGDVVAATADGLAVREEPSLSSPLVKELTYSESGFAPTGRDVRLNAGHQIFVNLGPLMLDGRPWYRVESTAQPGEEYASLDFDPGADGSPGRAWVAAADGSTPLLELVKPNAYVTGPGAPVAAGWGDSNWVSDPFVTPDWSGAEHALVASWALGGEAPASCAFSLTLQPAGIEFGQVSLTDSFESGRWVPADGIGLPSGEFTLVVSAGDPADPTAPCPWAMVLTDEQG